MSDYDPNYVEKPAFFRISLKAILVNERNEILILKRSERGGGMGWSFPGGGLEAGEEVSESIRREIAEETGMLAGNLNVFCVFTSAARADDVCIGFTATATGDIRLNWEHDDYQWRTPKDAAEHCLTLHAKELLRRYLEVYPNAQASTFVRGTLKNR